MYDWSDTGMNKNKIPILVCVTAMCFILFCNFCNVNVSEKPKEMDVVSTHSVSFTNFREENIVVILNKTDVTDFETTSYEIIQKLIADDFQSVCFDWQESGYPNALHATIFETESEWNDWKPLFEFSYTHEQEPHDYNISDDKEQFTLKINSNIIK